VISGFPTLFVSDDSSMNLQVSQTRTQVGIWYSASSSLDLIGFSNADFAGCGIDRKSTSGTCYFLGSSLICWSSQK
jgi:hypothetical protein